MGVRHPRRSHHRTSGRTDTLITRKDFESLARALRDLPLLSRVQTFNVIAPWAKSANARFSLIDFYEAVFTLGETVSTVQLDQYDHVVTLKDGGIRSNEIADEGGES